MTDVIEISSSDTEIIYADGDIADVEIVYVGAADSLEIVETGNAIINIGNIGDGNKGDITVSGSGSTWSINNLAITLGKLAATTYSALNGVNTLVQRNSVGSFAIGNIDFATLTIPNIGVITGAGLTTSTTAPNQLLDSFDINTFRSAKYTVQIDSGIDYHTIEYLVVHNGLDPPKSTRYAQIFTTDELAQISFDINGSNLQMLVTPQNPITRFKVFRTTIRT